jgi:hypothetical protein
MLYRLSTVIQKEGPTGLILGRGRVSGRNRKVSEIFEVLKVMIDFLE